MFLAGALFFFVGFLWVYERVCLYSANGLAIKMDADAVDLGSSES